MVASAQRRQKDVEARWTKKHGKSYFGNLRRESSEVDTRHLQDVLDWGNSRRDFWADRG